MRNRGGEKHSLCPSGAFKVTHVIVVVFAGTSDSCRGSTCACNVVVRVIPQGCGCNIWGAPLARAKHLCLKGLGQPTVNGRNEALHFPQVTSNFINGCSVRSEWVAV